MSYAFYFFGGLVALAAVFGVVLGKPRRRGLDSPDARVREHADYLSSGASGLGGRYGGPGGF